MRSLLALPDVATTWATVSAFGDVTGLSLASFAAVSAASFPGMPAWPGRIPQAIIYELRGSIEESGQSRWPGLLKRNNITVV